MREIDAGRDRGVRRRAQEQQLSDAEPQDVVDHRRARRQRRVEAARRSARRSGRAGAARSRPAAGQRRGRGPTVRPSPSCPRSRRRAAACAAVPHRSDRARPGVLSVRVDRHQGSAARCCHGLDVSAMHSRHPPNCGTASEFAGRNRTQSFRLSVRAALICRCQNRTNLSSRHALPRRKSAAQKAPSQRRYGDWDANGRCTDFWPSLRTSGRRTPCGSARASRCRRRAASRSPAPT